MRPLFLCIQNCALDALQQDSPNPGWEPDVVHNKLLTSPQPSSGLLRVSDPLDQTWGGEMGVHLSVSFISVLYVLAEILEI